MDLLHSGITRAGHSRQVIKTLPLLAAQLTVAHLPPTSAKSGKMKRVDDVVTTKSRVVVILVSSNLQQNRARTFKWWETLLRMADFLKAGNEESKATILFCCCEETP